LLDKLGVIAGLDPEIQFFAKRWTPGSSPGATAVRIASMGIDKALATSTARGLLRDAHDAQRASMKSPVSMEALSHCVF
jgi:hypothetical protein